MRALADAERIRRFMRELGDAADLYRYPAVNPGTFRAAVTEMFG
jgi:hypothetical protein